jgi:hypothetical protein
MPEAGQCSFASVGVEHIGDGNVSVSKLATGDVNVIGCADPV